MIMFAGVYNVHVGRLGPRRAYREDKSRRFAVIIRYYEILRQESKARQRALLLP